MQQGKRKKRVERERRFVLVDAGALYDDLKAEARRRQLSPTAYLRQILYRELREKNTAA